MSKLKDLKVGKEVVVISGANKKKEGKILQVNRSKNTVIVENVNLKRKRKQPTQESPEGGYAELEFPIHASNVVLKDDLSSKD